MVPSRLAFVKYLAIALGALSLCLCGVEFALHLLDACAACDAASARDACAPSWTVHHLLKPDVRVVASNPDNQKRVTWRTNSLGLRGPEPGVPKPSSTYRIVCLGDEATLAAETPTGETFCDRLQMFAAAASPMRIEVINAGCPQYGPLLSFLLLKHSLLALSPDLIVLNFDMSDVADDHRCRRSVRMSGRQPLFCPHPDLEWKRSAAEKVWVERLLLWRHVQRGVGSLLGGEGHPEDLRDIDSPRGMYAWLRDDPPDWSLYVAETLDMIGQISEFCRQSHSAFVLAVIPCPWQISAEASDGPGVRASAGLQEHVLYSSRGPVEALTAFAKQRGIPFCDPSPVFERSETPERLFLKNAPRFSASGHELYARIVSAYLVQNVAGPWASEGAPRAPVDRQFTAAGSTPGTSAQTEREAMQHTGDAGPIGDAPNSSDEVNRITPPPDVRSAEAQGRPAAAWEITR